MPHYWWNQTSLYIDQRLNPIPGRLKKVQNRFISNFDARFLLEHLFFLETRKKITKNAQKQYFQKKKTIRVVSFLSYLWRLMGFLMFYKMYYQRSYTTVYTSPYTRVWFLYAKQSCLRGEHRRSRVWPQTYNDSGFDWLESVLDYEMP